MKKHGLIIIVNFLIANAFIFAQPMDPNPPAGPKGEGIKKVLNLSPEQEKKFDDIHYQGQQETVDVKAKVQKNRLELKKILDDGNLDEKKFLQLTNENTNLLGDLKNSVSKRWLDIYKMLNDDQKKVWTKHLNKMANVQVMKKRIGERIQGRFRNFMMNRRPMMRMERGF